MRKVILLFVAMLVGFRLGNLTGNEPDFWSVLSLCSMLTIMSVLAVYAKEKSYRGGAATTIGAICIALAVFTTVSAFEDGDFAAGGKSAFTAVSVIMLLLIAGVALLRQGHMHHRLLQDKENNLRG